MTKKSIYLDYCSTTPVDQEVLEAMWPYFSKNFGNASSRTHSYGWLAEDGVELAAKQISDLLRCNADELIFTSGATESVNLAIKGIFNLYRARGHHIISAKTEHRAVLDTIDWAQKQGAEVSWLKVNQKGNIDLDELKATIRKDTIMVSLMWANNETGLIHPVEEIGKICRESGVLFVSDATQALGKIPVHPRESMVDLIAFSAHKFYGPKGVGGLYLSSSNPRVKLTPQIHGGGHQQNIRSGTLNVPGIVGMGKAAEIAQRIMKKESEQLKNLRDKLENLIVASIPETIIIGDQNNRLPHVTNIGFRLITSSELLGTISGQLALSSGSACTSGSGKASHVLRNMGITDEWSQSAIRFSLGRFNTENEISIAAEILRETSAWLRALNPVWKILFEE